MRHKPIRPKTLNAASLANHDFFPEDFEEFASNDTPVSRYRGYTIALSMPNGGILAVSIWKRSTQECYSNLTEGSENFPGYYNAEGHIELAKGAIDAATPEPIADQLCLLQ